MYLGRMVEIADKEELYNHPLHPYTKALLSAIPVPDVDVVQERILLEGDLPSPYNPPAGCLFHTRCRYATDRCRTEVPEMKEVCQGHCVACHLFER
jgi:oligopeptide/dipeptide ABC transporter ATP-binding protein